VSVFHQFHVDLLRTGGVKYLLNKLMSNILLSGFVTVLVFHIFLKHWPIDLFAYLSEYILSEAFLHIYVHPQNLPELMLMSVLNFLH